jgi:hypothetical protein
VGLLGRNLGTQGPKVGGRENQRRSVIMEMGEGKHSMPVSVFICGIPVPLRDRL